MRGLIAARRPAAWHWHSAVAQLVELALDYLPSRKRLRYGDIDYDFEHGVNTTWAAPTLAVRLREIFTRGKYQPSEPELFTQILDELKIDSRALHVYRPGKRQGPHPADGFRLSVPSDHRGGDHSGAARRLRWKICSVIGASSRSALRLEAWLGDAREFPFPDEPMVVYLFNPFPADILREVLEDLRQIPCDDATRDLRDLPQPGARRCVPRDAVSAGNSSNGAVRDLSGGVAHSGRRSGCELAHLNSQTLIFTEQCNEEVCVVARPYSPFRNRQRGWRSAMKLAATVGGQMVFGSYDIGYSGVFQLNPAHRILNARLRGGVRGSATGMDLQRRQYRSRTWAAAINTRRFMLRRE